MVKFVFKFVELEAVDVRSQCVNNRSTGFFDLFHQKMRQNVCFVILLNLYASQVECLLRH